MLSHIKLGFNVSYVTFIVAIIFQEHILFASQRTDSIGNNDDNTLFAKRGLLVAAGIYF